jgi:hypothetical protein
MKPISVVAHIRPKNAGNAKRSPGCRNGKYFILDSVSIAPLPTYDPQLLTIKSCVRQFLQNGLGAAVTVVIAIVP